MKNLIDIIKKGWLAQKPIQFLLVGKPGEGKTAIIRKAAVDIDAELLVCAPAIDEPTDYKGFPTKEKGRAEFLPFGNLRTMLEWGGGKSGQQLLVVFFDDLAQAGEMVQAALMPILQGAEINGQKIARPDLVRFVAATNDVAGNNGAGGLIEPLKGRFHSILPYRATVEAWTTVALEIDIHESIVAYLNFRPDHLTRGNADFDPAEIVNFPSPRTWERLSDLIAISDGLSSQDRLKLFSGAVGKNAAFEFCSFLEASHDFPTAKEVAADPTGARLPAEMSLYFAMSIMLLKHATPSNIEAFWTYLKRFKKRDVLSYWLKKLVKMENEHGGTGNDHWFWSHPICSYELVTDLFSAAIHSH